MVANRKMEQDFPAIGLIQDLKKDLDKRNPKDLPKLAKGIGDVFKTGKTRKGGQDLIYPGGRRRARGARRARRQGARANVTHKRFKDNSNPCART